MLTQIKKCILLILGLLAMASISYANSNTKLIIENNFKDKSLYILG